MADSIGGFTHYPTQVYDKLAEHPQPERDDGHMSQTADPPRLHNA
ncbi:MAG: hypothetical protein ABSA78_15955 [Candidatus Sulfotelmatobacter sp.]